MEPKTERLLLILADISGYTEFMLASQVALVHGQQVITNLIEAILREVEIPLEVKEIEGDAVFLYAIRPRDNEAWSEICEEVGRKLLRFFEAFSAVLVAESESTLCPCAVCQHMHELKLKIIVHSGEALLVRPHALDTLDHFVQRGFEAAFGHAVRVVHHEDKVRSRRLGPEEAGGPGLPDALEGVVEQVPQALAVAEAGAGGRESEQ